MKLFILFNTDGYLGGWGFKEYYKPENLTDEHLDRIRKSRGDKQTLTEKKKEIIHVNKLLKKAITKDDVSKLSKKLNLLSEEYRGMYRGMSLVTGMPITQKMIDEAKENNKFLIVDMDNNDAPIFVGAIECRDNVDVVPSDDPNFDTEFGNLRLKFNSDQSQKLLKKTKDAMKMTIQGRGAIRTKHDHIIEEIFDAGLKIQKH